MDTVTVRRSAWRMWGVSLAGVPLVVIAYDVLFTHRITDLLRGALFRPDDTQLLEPRDLLWGAVFGVVGLILVGWGLLELIRPTVVLEADGTGLTARLSGPLRSPTRLSWGQIDDIGAGRVDDEGVELPVLWIRVFDGSLLPENPWGARILDDGSLAILSADWDQPANDVAPRLVDLAVAAFEEPDEPADDLADPVPDAESP